MLGKLICVSLLSLNFLFIETTNTTDFLFKKQIDNTNGKPCKLIHYENFPKEGFCNAPCWSLREYNEIYAQPLYICDLNSYDELKGFSYCCSNPTSGTTRLMKKKGEKRIERISEKKCWEQHYTPIPSNVFFVGIFPLPEEFPHMSIIGWREPNGTYDFKCAGSLIAPNFVVTAAHCIKSKGIEPSVVIVGGTNLNNESAELLPIIKVFIHPEYSTELVYNDIALLELGKNSSNRIACLWQTDATFHVEVTAIGYGYTEADEKSSKDLIKGNLSIFTNDYCKQFYPPNKKYPNSIIDSQICIGDPEGKDTCKGDSVGPIEIKLIRRFNEVPIILGITSFGGKCGSQIPGVYTRISSYLDWIESIVWAN